MPLRRLHSRKPVVIVTADSAMYYELMHRLHTLVAAEPSLDVSQVYLVYGRGKDVKVLEAACVDR